MAQKSGGMDTGTWLVLGVVGIIVFLGFSITSTLKSIVSLPVRLLSTGFRGLNNLLDAVVP